MSITPVSGLKMREAGSEKGLSDPCAQDIAKNCDTVGGLRCVQGKGEGWLRDGTGGRITVAHALSSISTLVRVTHQQCTKRIRSARPVRAVPSTSSMSTTQSCAAPLVTRNVVGSPVAPGAPAPYPSLPYLDIDFGGLLSYAMGLEEAS
jgi:hypothetical protein